MRTAITNPIYYTPGIEKTRYWNDKLVGKVDPLFMDLISKMVVYVPEDRLTAL